jgi:hypothetical protein
LHGAEGFAVGEAFDGGDFCSGGGYGEGEAGIDAAAVDEDGAGSALSVVAAFFAAGEVEVLAECVEERGAGIEGDGVGGSVDAECDGDGVAGSRGGLMGGGEAGDSCGGGCADEAGGLEETTAGDFDVSGGGFGGLFFEEVGIGAGGGTHEFASQISGWGDGEILAFIDVSWSW